MKDEYQLDPQIDEAITRLQKKMLDVNHSLAETKSRNEPKKSQKNSKKSTQSHWIPKPLYIREALYFRVVALMCLDLIFI